MKCFNQAKWDQLHYKLKVAVACRYCVLPYFSNLVIQTGLSKEKVHMALEHLTDLGKLDESWYLVKPMWVKLYKYNDRHDNDFMDGLINDMLEA